jgi:hypothetical protein
MTPVQAIDLAARFTFDEARARDWLGRVIAAYPGPCEDDEVCGDAPAISDSWDPREVDEEATVDLLVQAAVADGLILAPDGMTVDIVYTSGDRYHFAVDIGAPGYDQVSIATFGYEIHRLGSPGTHGAEAALAVWEEAVSAANGALDKLCRLISRHGYTVAQASSTRPTTVVPELDQCYLAGTLPVGSVVTAGTATEYVICRTGLCMRWEQPIPLSHEWNVTYRGRLPGPGERMTPRECAEVDMHRRRRTP